MEVAIKRADKDNNGRVDLEELRIVLKRASVVGVPEGASVVTVGVPVEAAAAPAAAAAAQKA
jgi:Ca2+-binding EF-hand superfamily protein